MKAVDILEKAEKIEKTILMIRKPTKELYGYAIKLTGDPMIVIMKIDNSDSASFTPIKIDKKKYWIVDSMKVPVSIVRKLRHELKKLIEMEI